MPIHSTAIVDPAAQIAPTATIDPHVVIEGAVIIGPGSRVGPSSTIIGNTTVGRDCRVGSHVTIGEAPQDNKYRGQPTHCRIGDRCVLREGVTVHRATTPGGATSVGNRCLLMTNSHVGHDCVLQDEVILESGALLGGHVHVGRSATISQNAGVHQFVRIGELALVGSVAMIAQDVPPFLATDHDGKIVGINTTGVNDAGMSSENQRELETLLKLLYGSGMSLQKGLELAGEIAISDVGHRFIEFFRNGTSRGFRKRIEGTNGES